MRELCYGAGTGDLRFWIPEDTWVIWDWETWVIRRKHGSLGYANRTEEHKNFLSAINQPGVLHCHDGLLEGNNKRQIDVNAREQFYLSLLSFYKSVGGRKQDKTNENN